MTPAVHIDLVGMNGSGLSGNKMLLVRKQNGLWGFPSVALGDHEKMREAAVRVCDYEVGIPCKISPRIMFADDDPQGGVRISFYAILDASRTPHTTKHGNLPVKWFDTGRDRDAFNVYPEWETRARDQLALVRTYLMGLSKKSVGSRAFNYSDNR